LRFCWFYFAADRLWKTLDFYHELAILYNRMDNSLTIPKALTSLIESGFWPRNSAEANRQHQRCLVPEAAIRFFAPEEEKIYFYPPPFSTVRQHQSKTSFWSDPRAAIHEIKPDLTLMIGDFGIGSDAGLLLDYSQTATDPRVLRLKWAQEGNHWVEVAATFDQFANMLKGQKTPCTDQEKQFLR
jgi:hypothetical protein